jgi:hypothetical protein
MLKKTLIVLMLVALWVVPSLAQTTPAPNALTMTHRATAGTLTDNEDGTVTLTLEGVSERVSFLSRGATLNAGAVELAGLADAWSTVEGLTARGVLTIGDVTVVLTVGAPSYDVLAGTLTYVGELVSVNGAEAAPTEFEKASMFVQASATFIEEMGAAADEIGLRDCKQCSSEGKGGK